MWFLKLIMLIQMSGANASPIGRSHQEMLPPAGLDLYMPVPEDNRFTPEKVHLGRRLFRDSILSRTAELSCETCHDPLRAFTDGRRLSIGVLGRTGNRNVPTLINRGYGSAFFWDGRTSTLEEQVVKPIQDSSEMDLPLDQAVSRLKGNSEYRRLFRRTFGRDVNAADLGRALAAYARTIMSGNSPVDRYVNGDVDALSPRALRGMQIFRSKGNCTACHVGPNFSDERFHNTGVAWRDGRWLDDGRFAVTGTATDRGAFKTPTLREIARTAPYMHDGSKPTLEEVIDFYDRGGNPNLNLDREIRPLRLSADEKDALLAFLQSLTGTVREGVQ